MSEPQTRRVAVIGGGHIAPETARLLADTPVKAWPFAGGVFAYGFLIYAHDENCEGTIPPDVWSVCEWARARGFDYVMLDCDAEPVDGLPVYDYGDAEDSEPQSAPPPDPLDLTDPWVITDESAEPLRLSAFLALNADGFSEETNRAVCEAIFAGRSYCEGAGASAAWTVSPVGPTSFAPRLASYEPGEAAAAARAVLEADAEAFEREGSLAQAAECRRAAEVASPDPEGQSAPADDGDAEAWTEWDDEALDNLTDDATHAVNNLIPAIRLDYMTDDERSDLLVRINDALSPILADVLQS